MKISLGRLMGFGLLLALVLAQGAEAGALADRWRGSREQDGLAGAGEGARGGFARDLPPGVVREADVPYGPDGRQRFDVYRLSAGAGGAPILIMVHGGGWRHGDKAMGSVVGAKLARWVPRGVILVSVNYRLLPQAGPPEQVADVARALDEVRRRAGEWGGDGSQVVLMGHSAGAHLVAQLGATPRTSPGVVGTVALDSGALDVERIMKAPHFPLYDQAFGPRPEAWRGVSPILALERGAAPILAVCSSQRRVPCPEAEDFARRGGALGNRVQVLPQALSHREINQTLGEGGAYTSAVEAFLKSLSPAWRSALGD